MIGVDPGHQGLGLGRALTVAGLEPPPRRNGPSTSACCSSTRRTPPPSASTAPSGSSPAASTARTVGPPRCWTAMNRYGRSHEPNSTTCSPPSGEPRYRVDQVWNGLYAQRLPLDDDHHPSPCAPRAPRRRRSRSRSTRCTRPPRPTASRRSGSGRRAPRRRSQVETVLMRTAQRATVCVSSQAGCAMACTFCATGQAGLDRHLDTGEIVEQVVRAQHGSPQRVSNVVFMGMGEPLANYDAVWAADRATAPATSGSRPVTSRQHRRRRARDAAPARPKSLPVTLAVSLHAPDDELREHARAAEPSLSDRRRARRRRRGRGRPRPAGQLRVRRDRRA